MKTNRVGIFSGTFDPIHIGHVEACLVALAACELEKVLVMVEKAPKRKQLITSFQDRLEMVKLALDDFESMEVVDIGADNVTVNNTKTYLRKKYPGFQPVLILGADALAHLEDWDDAKDIFETMEVCIVLRKLDDEKTAGKAVEKLQKKYKETKFHLLPPVWSEVSSSVVKKDIQQNGTTDLVHRNVLRYIKDKKLY